MTVAVRPLDAYLDRLRDALPPAKADAVVAEVSSLVDDRVEQTGKTREDPTAVAQALDALGPPEALASALVGGGLTIDLATRRAYVRLLAVVFAGHLLASIVLTVVGAKDALVPGLVSPLPSGSAVATAFGVLGILPLDAGLLGASFALLGRERAPAVLARLRLAVPGSRREAGTSLLLLGLLAVLANVAAVRDAVFAVGSGASRVPLLSADAIALVPWIDAVLGLFALRHLLLLASGGERAAGVAVDALASLAATVVVVIALTRDALVRVASSPALSEDQAKLFENLLYRVLVMVLFVAGILLATRFVKRLLRLRDLLARARATA
jgi:hypothetical protein